MLPGSTRKLEKMRTLMFLKIPPRTKAAIKPIGKDFSIPMNSTIFELKKMVQELWSWDDLSLRHQTQEAELSMGESSLHQVWMSCQ